MKNGNKLIIEIDGIPMGINPLLVYEYNAKFLVQFLYFKLKNRINCHIVSKNNMEYWIYLTECFEVVNIGAKEFVNCIYFHKREESSPVHRLFSAIKKCECKRNIIYIYLYFPMDFFTDLLQSSYIVACNDDIPIHKATYLEKANSIIVKKNVEWEFIINTDYKKSKALFMNDDIDITCHSHGSPDNILLDNLANNEGSMVYYLGFKNVDIKNVVLPYINIIKVKLKEILPDFIDIINSFCCTEDAGVNLSKLINIKKEEIIITLAYLDYFPNEIIATQIKNSLAAFSIKIILIKINSLQELVHKRKNYDAYLAIVYPFFNHPFGIVMNFINELDLVQKRNFNKLFAKGKKLSEIFEFTEKSIPIAKSRNLYNRKSWCKDISFTSYGDILLGFNFLRLYRDYLYFWLY